MTQVRHTVLPAFLAAAALHAALLGFIALRPPAPPPPRPRAPVTLRMATRPRPPPPPASPPAPRPPPAPPRVTPAPRPAAPRVASAAPPPPVPPPVAAPPPAPGPPPGPRRFAVSMSATAPGGGVAVPTTAGPTAARGDPSAPASAPVGDNTPFATAAPVDVTEVERAPRMVRQPSDLELRGLYPEAARRERLEADVRLELLVGPDGRVAGVRVVEPAGNGFDEVAVKAARQIVFQPAQRGGRPVAVRIPWTLRFRIDG